MNEYIQYMYIYSQLFNAHTSPRYNVQDNTVCNMICKINLIIKQIPIYNIKEWNFVIIMLPFLFRTPSAEKIFLTVCGMLDED